MLQIEVAGQQLADANFIIDYQYFFFLHFFLSKFLKNKINHNQNVIKNQENSCSGRHDYGRPSFTG
jgi:hypothetical protein